MLTKREIIAIAIESTYNTPVVPAASDALLVEDVGFNYEGARMVERAPIKPTLGKEKSIFAGTLGQVTFTAEIKGSGTAGTAPEIGKALRCCGMGETIVASTSVTYEPVSEAIESCTIYYYQDGKLRRLSGCRGTWELSGNVGEIPKISFTFTGHIDGEVDAALISPTYDATVPAPFLNAGFDVGGFAAEISTFSLSIGNEISTPPSASSPDGFGEIRIGDRDVAGGFDPEMELNSVQNYVQDWKDGTSKVITTGVIGSTAGNRYQVTINEGYYREVSDGDRDNIRTNEIGFGCDGDDNSFEIAFT